MKLCKICFYQVLFYCFSSSLFAADGTEPLSLKQSIEESISGHPDLMKVKRELRAVRAGFWEAISPDYPELFMEHEGIPDQSGFSQFEGKKWGIAQQFNFPLKYVLNGNRQKHQRQYLEAEVLDVQNHIIRNTIKAYYKVILLKKKTLLYDSMASITRQNLRKAKIRVRAGETSPYDTLKVKVDLAEVENRVLENHRMLVVALSELGILIGRDSERIHIQEDLSFVPMGFDLDSLESLASQHHPDVYKVRARYIQKRSEHFLAWTNLLPTVHLRYFRQELPNDLDSNRWGGEVGLSIPLWFFLKGQGSIRRTNHQMEAARWQIRSTMKTVTLDLEKALAQVVIAQIKVKNYKEKTLTEVEELIRIATRSYEEGEMGYLELNEAVQTHHRIKAGYFDTLYHYLCSLADLEYTVGTTLVFSH